MKVFLSYYSDDEALAEDIAKHLTSTFSSYDLEVFRADSWDSLVPADKWEDKLIEAIMQADALVVLMSIDALGRPWLNFEIGVAWAKDVRVILCCHRGMTRDALPRPYGSLQAIDLSALTHDVKLAHIADAVARNLNIKASPMGEIPEVQPSEDLDSFFSVNRRWSLLPGAHVRETAKGRFLVGSVRQSYPERAKAAKLKPAETLYVRLFLGTAPEGRYIDALVTGDAASFFERIVPDTTLIDAEVRLAGVFVEGEKTIPLIVIDQAEAVRSE